MKESFYSNKKARKIGRMLATGICLIVLLCALCLGTQAKTVRDYSVNLDSPQSGSVTGMPLVITGYELGTQEKMTFSGWIKTEMTMQSYEYSINGNSWVQVDAVRAREDTKKFCPNTWETAGFYFSIDTANMPRGRYDIFLRGYTSEGDVINVLAMLDVSIGLADVETPTYREINLLALGAHDGVLTLEAGQACALGELNVRDFKRVEIVSDSDAVLTLASADAESATGFSITPESVQQNEDGTYTSSFVTNGLQFAGDISLSAARDTQISQIQFFYHTPDYYTDALKIHMTVTPYDYLSGANSAAASLMADQTVGTYIRLYPTNDTNDPFIYFNMGTYLKQSMNVQLNADNYPYAVITAQSPATNSSGHFRLFLCAGAIRGPSGDSHVSFSPINDGEWHTYVVPLCEEENWTGTIYGMRFDFIDGNAVTTDYTNIASVGLYPDLESARAAADAPFEVYHEQGNIPSNKFEEEGRAPSGRSDAITWFDPSLAPCFGGENKVSVGFDEYGHLILTATEPTNDPYVSFDMQTYTSLTGTEILKAQEHTTIVLRVLADEHIRGKNFILYYYSGGLNYAEGTRTAIGNYDGGDWEYIVYDMKDEPYWTDDILGMRLDFAGDISSGQSVYVSDILFFADMDAWQTYATEQGILTEQATIGEQTTEEIVTERPTIEIPTKGPGLEYIPPEDTTQTENTEGGCKGSVAFPFLLLLLPVCLIFGYQFNHKKGDRL